MKVKKIVKCILSAGAGATMLGATVMGAMAADLSNYPDMLVQDGVFNGLMVVGENAAAVDNLAMTDIAASMKYKASDAGATVSVEGDAFLVKAGTDELEFGEALGTTTHGVLDFVDGDDLAALADGTLASSKGSFNYEQFIHFDDPVVNTTYVEDDDDVTALFLKVPDNSQFARYEMNFLDAAKSDVDSSTSYKLDDLEKKSITLLGKTYNIVQARTNAISATPQITLTLMSGSASDQILEGETKTFTLDGKEYEVSLIFTNTADQAKFTVNGETTPVMDEGDTETLSDGVVLGLSEVLYQDYAGGIHQAEFYLGADKLELQDDNFNQTMATATSSDDLKVNDETIDGAAVTIFGSVTTAWSATADGELEIDDIQVNMTAQDDYFVAAGETLLGQPELEEKSLVFTENWDLRFEGMDQSVLTDELKVADQSGEKEYWLTFTNVKGDVINMPLAYANGATLRFGSQDDKLQLNKTSIQDEQYFILNDDTDEDSVTSVVQYKGTDKFGASDPKAKFKVLGTGETVERPITFGAGQNGATFNLKLGGNTYTFANASSVGGAAAGGGNVDADDWNITVTGGHAATALTARGPLGVNYETDFLIARGGAKIWVEDMFGNDTANSIRFNVSLLDADAIDDRNAVPYLIKGYNITAASSEVDLATEVGFDFVNLTLTSPQDDDDNSYGYSANGAWVKRNSPSGGGSSADTLTIEWPHKERLPMVYLTSGAVASSTSAGGDLKAVTFVDATKLDSEVADVKAQNLVVVGGPCVNTAAAELLGNPTDCAEGFTPGKARVKLFEHANGNVAMLVAGYSGADTRLAGKVVANRAGELSGKEMVVEGTTYADATLSKTTSN
ncbi:MAG: hypothetical protein AABX64_02700 [Nanoarchaeota archaeon]